MNNIYLDIINNLSISKSDISAKESQLQKIADILCIDRNADNKIDIFDFIAIKNDAKALLYLITSMLALVNDSEYTDVIKIFLYIVINVIPQKTGVKIIVTEQDKMIFKEIVVDMVNIINNSEAVKKVIKKIESTDCCIFIKTHLLTQKNMQYLKQAIVKLRS